MNIRELKNRSLSFLWRLAGMVLVAVLAFVGSNLDLINVSPAVIGLISLLVGEATKWLNNEFALGEKAIGAVKRLSGR
ncbi:hypothetical protein A3F59_02630 [Candidatus Roizmanbacteria bacterium RIFCSPHIGHO2_12_FULL_38_13]|nr:MAG: hypothetical protein A3F59_02630 [Candidatus Roizmanbacteria bacterium RIFCSPHIGHO2_12_FULL_38_13]